MLESSRAETTHLLCTARHCFFANNSNILANANNSNVLAKANNSNILANAKGKDQVMGNVVNSLNIDAKPFYVAKSGENVGEGLKRSRSTNAAAVGGDKELETGGNKARRKSNSPEKNSDWSALLPDSEDFEEAIIAAVLGSSAEPEKMKLGGKGKMVVVRDHGLGWSWEWKRAHLSATEAADLQCFSLHSKQNL